MAYQPTTNFGWAMPRGGDQAQISVINQQFTAKADEIVYQTRRMIAPGYIDDGSKTYQPGEIVEYENVDYVCTGTTSGAWDSSKWDSTDMATQIQEAKESGGTNVEANPVEAATADLHKLKVDTTVYGIHDPTVTKTATGNPVEFSDGANAPIVKCTTEITGSQDLHGYDRPWVGGAGKNKLPLPAEQTINGVTLTYLEDGGIKLTGSLTDVAYFDCFAGTFDSTTYAGYVFKVSYSESTSGIRFRISQSDRVAVQEIYNNTVISDNGSDLYLALRITSSTVIPSSGLIIYPMLLSPSETNYDFAPYSNICPITAYTEGEIEVSDGDGNTTTHTTTYPSAIYRGSEDVVNGEVTSEWVYTTLSGGNDENWIQYTSRNGDPYFVIRNKLTDAPIVSTTGIADAITSRYPIDTASNVYKNNIAMSISGDGSTIYDPQFTSLTDLKTALANNPIEIVYRLANPTTSSVTPTNLPIKTLSGYNHIESSTGEMEVEYITEGYQPLVDLIEANSGKHVYSTEEKVVGTWIDGKTIYEKTYTNATEQSVSYQTWTPTVISATDIDRIVNLFTTRDADGGTYIPVVTRKENGYVEIFAAVGWTYNNITIQYTKTSSNTRSLSKGATEGLRADLSEEKKEIEESVDKVDKVDKVDEPTETIEEKEENAGESNSENER